MADENDQTPEKAGYDFQVKTLEAGGVEISDGYGNAWSRPADNTTDLADLGAVHPVTAIARRFRALQPDMDIESVGVKDAEVARLAGWVPIRRAEVFALENGGALLEMLDTEYGKPTADILRYIDSILMKIPKILNKDKIARKNARAEMVRASTEPSKEALDRAMRTGAATSAQDVVRRQNAEGEPVQFNETRRVSKTLTGFTPVE